MKDFIIPIAIFALLMLFVPMFLVGKAQNVNNSLNTYATAIETINQNGRDLVFQIRDGKTGKNETVAGFDFICGVVAAEMPVSYNSEALKAQAVAAFTYCCYQKEQGGALITTGLSVAYLSRDEAKAKWGSAFNDLWGKIELAVSDVYGKALFYNGKVIEATFYDMSSGITESCKDVFGQDQPYLVEVSSPGDTLQKDFISHAEFSLDDFKAKVKAFNPKPDFNGEPSSYLKVVSRSGAGGVMSADLCGKTVTGRDIRTLFGLRSTNFNLSYNNGKFIFEVKGYGHGVGMSQRGAEYMAEQGKSWEEILLWYYKGTEIKDISGVSIV
ncbi:MAG TPA: stage II sporulation protein D [Ruminiclostridium sp.]|nr:stage II sporulation protein D [Ruminiclostridium sp.]